MNKIFIKLSFIVCLCMFVDIIAFTQTSTITLYPTDNKSILQISKDGSKSLLTSKSSVLCDGKPTTNYFLMSVNKGGSITLVKENTSLGMGPDLNIPFYGECTAYGFYYPYSGIKGYNGAYFPYSQDRNGVDGFFSLAVPLTSSLQLINGITPNNDKIIGWLSDASTSPLFIYQSIFATRNGLEKIPFGYTQQPNTRLLSITGAISNNGRYVTGNTGYITNTASRIHDGRYSIYVWNSETKQLKTFFQRGIIRPYGYSLPNAISDDGSKVIIGGNQVISLNSSTATGMSEYLKSQVKKIILSNDTINVDSFFRYGIFRNYSFGFDVGAPLILDVGTSPNFDTIVSAVRYRGKDYVYAFRNSKCADLDNDGVCADIDCNDNNANIKTEDKDKDGVCSDEDCNDNDPLIKRKGDLCDDRDPNTINDKIDVNCRCVGTSVNKVLFSHYLTQPNNPNLPLSSNELGGTNPILNPFKVCADGSNVSQFTISGISVKDYKLVLREDPNGLDVAKYGKLTSINKTDDTVTYQYQHPNIFPESVTTPFQIFKIDVFKLDNGRDALVDAVPLYVYRAPVVIVHGFNSDPTGYDLLRNKLLETYESDFIYLGDYRTTSSAQFVYNTNVVPKFIDSTKKALTITKKIAVGKVDIVAHSMGGVLTRLYLQSVGNDYRSDVHKFIVCNTPHWGTQFANLVSDGTIIGSWTQVREILCKFILRYDYCGNESPKPGLSDFRVNSDGTIKLINGVSLNKNIVPTHAIATTIASTSELLTSNVMTNVVNWLAASLVISTNMKSLYNNDEHDIVVPLASQLGGLNSRFTTIIPKQGHTLSYRNSAFINAVSSLLKEDLNNPNSRFSTEGFKFQQLTYFNNQSSRQRTAILENISINLTSPTKKDTFSIGETVLLKVNASANVNKIVVMVHEKSDSSFIGFKAGLSDPNFQLPTQNMKQGKKEVTIIGVDSISGSISFDTSYFFLSVPRLKDCPTLNKNIGDACDDGNPLTTNDKITADCTCKGTTIVKDCPIVQKNIGDACDDGNPNTTNDKIQANCTCAGTATTSSLTITCPANIEVTIPQGAGYANVNWNLPIANSNCSTSGGGCTATSLNSFTFVGELNGHQYYLSNQVANWRDAKQLCVNNGGYLAAITSQAETDYLKSKVREMVFIGLNDENTEGVFQWANGEPLGYTNWFIGQPAQGAQALTEDYAVFQNWDGKWDDVNGYVAKRALLEINCGSGTTPPPTVRQTAGFTNGNAFPVGITTVTYEAKDACNNVKICSFTVTIKQTTTTGGGSTTYCASKGNTPWEAWIGRVNFKQINQQSNKDSYGNFRGTIASVMTNEVVPISITPSFGYTQHSGFVRVWIDFNGDGDFIDAGEMVINQPYTGGLPNKAVVPITGNVTIPTTAKLGTTCMRVTYRQGVAPTPCDVWSNSNGEVEDYSVAITSNFQALVSLGNLKAQLIDNKARLDWTRRSDKIAYFEVEKSTNGRDFVLLEKVFSNPNDVYHYIFDNQLIEGDNYYQLKIVQLDGTIDYTPIQQLFYEKMFDFTVFPNPAKDEVWIDLKAFEGRTINILLSDIAGKVIHTEKVEKAAAAPHRLEVSSIESGAYFITIQTSGKRTVVRKVSIMK